jgi:imidazolonepropionase-like amidohydrolase
VIPVTTGSSGCLPASIAGLLRLVPRRLARGRLRRRPVPSADSRGVALRGAVWTGYGDDTFDGVVVVGVDGRIAAIIPSWAFTAPRDMPVVDCAWVGPGVTDAHVRLGGAAPGHDGFSGALVAVRDMGSTAASLAAWRSSTPVVVVGAGPTSVGMRACPAPGTALVLDGAAAARRAVARLVAEDIDVLEVHVVGDRGADGRGADDGRAGPTGMRPGELTAVVDAAHAAGLPVVAHALSVAAVRAALGAGVDELANVPVEPLPPGLVDRLADTGVLMASTLHRGAAAGPGAARNAADLHRAGVKLVYGTGAAVDPLRAGPLGVDPRELDRLAFAGLGRLGALRAATVGAAAAAGLAGRAPSGRIDVGARAALVGLYADPLVEPVAWCCPAAVARGTTLSRDDPAAPTSAPAPVAGPGRSAAATMGLC